MQPLYSLVAWLFRPSHILKQEGLIHESGKAGQTKFTVPELKFCSLTTVLSHGIQAFSSSLYLIYRSFCIKPGACMLHAIAIQLAHYNFTVLVCAEMVLRHNETLYETHVFHIMYIYTTLTLL